MHPAAALVRMPEHMTMIADIFDLPPTVHQGDFVLRLTEGLDNPGRTLDQYVVTPQLAACFDQALSLIGSAVESNSSKGAYLHGSFGSGKSHFMAVLSLLLDGNAHARAILELAGAVQKANTWTEGKRFLVVPFHMLSAKDMESGILGRYADFVRKLHPDAPTPGFYQAERIFADARNLRDTMGDGRFFARLNENASGGEVADGWGDLASGWDAGSFDEALAVPPGGEARVQLVGDLIDTYFSSVKSTAGDGERYTPLDEGLAIMSRHASALGYDALVLFLDELILWLAGRAGDPDFVQRESQKVVTLVEAMSSERAIPIISLIARQKDLRELVSLSMPGAEELNFSDTLQHANARFDEITLEDRNLPAIVERRVLRVKDHAARQTLDDAFERTARVRDEVLSTLLTREGDRAMFRQVYPFTPALVQTLVAVSSLLQRERTALKLMVQLLVDQGEQLEVGDVIPVGDLYDVIAAGDEPFTQAMKLRFEDAKTLYRSKLLRLLQDEHDVTLEDVQSGAADAQKAAAFRNDNRLMKTLLLSALAEGVEALRALTPARLAALNHGTVRSPIPGQESQIVLAKMQRWAAQVGEIKIADDGPNPTISLQVVGVDTESILEAAREFDNKGNRVQKVRQLIFEGLGLQDSSSDLYEQRYAMVWRGASRTCQLVVRNVREMRPEQLKNPEGVWQIVIDWPFDDPPHTPRDDLGKIQEFQERAGSANTIVWLPTFLNAAAQQDLGRLVRLEHVLTGNRLQEYGSHLSITDREQARTLLANQRDQLRARVRNTLYAAYDIRRNDRTGLDDTHGLDEHFVCLNPRFSLQPPVAADFREALEHVFRQALDAQFPDHPRFEIEVKRAGLKRVLDVLQRAVSEPEGRVEVERNRRDEVYRLTVPLKLGNMGETHFSLDRFWVDELDRKRAQHAADPLTVGDLRAWIEDPERRGLDRDVQNLVIISYALQKGLRFTLHGGPAPALIESLNDTLELALQALPAADDWTVAAERAGSIFGLSAGPLNAPNVAALVQAVSEVAADHREATDHLVERLRARLRARNLNERDSDRYRSASAALQLMSELASADEDAAVRVLADADVPTSAIAMGESLKGAAAALAVLEPEEWRVFESLAGLPAAYQPRVVELTQELHETLLSDEHVKPLISTVRRCQTQAIDLLREAARAAQPPPTDPAPVPAAARTGRRVVPVSEVRQVMEGIESAARETGAERVQVDWTVRPDADN